MTEDEFRASAQDKGYDLPVEKAWNSGHFNDWHVHPFCLYVFVLEGEMTLELETDGGVETTVCRPGDSIEVPLNVRHTERITGSQTRFVSAPRHPAG
ncbi:MAG: cupin domain-containing protein [Rhodospirillales bacterium]